MRSPMRIFARGSPALCHSGIGAGLFDQNFYQRRGEAFAHGPAFERCARRDAVAVAFSDQASAPSHHKGGGLAGGSNAASSACLSLVASIAGGNGSSDSTSPIGHGWVEGSGSRLATFAGVKFTDVWPTRSVTQPWLPKYLAVRVTPFGSVT